MSTTDYAIETRDLSKSFNGVQALQSLNLQVPRQSIFGFLGPNGAGKTTAMRILLGIARPTQGSGSILGMDIIHDSIEIRRRVGYLAQHPQFYEYLTARESLRLAARFFFSGPKDAIEARVQESLELVGLDHMADRPTRGFSGGERQRLGIAQAQIHQPELLILDEPAAALDPMGRRDVLGIMQRLRERTTIFYSTHILDDVQRVSDTVAILNRGQLIAQAPIEQLLSGSESTVYSLTVKGVDANIRRMLARVKELPWVQTAHATRVNGHVAWNITISDDAAAETELLRFVLADENIRVTEFGRKRYELEDIFMQIVEQN